MTRINTLFGLLLVFLLSACEQDPYDTGDGHLSHITTAFGETVYDAKGCAFKFVTDDDRTLNFTSLFGKPNGKLSDKTVRTLLYYNLTDDENTVAPYAIIGVLTANVIESDKIKDKAKDPLNVESVWLSANKKYINLSLKIKTSSPEDENLRHTLGMVFEGSDNDTAELQLVHSNGNIPGNYTVSTFFSVPVRSVLALGPDCNKVRIKVMTFEGEKTIEVNL